MNFRCENAGSKRSLMMRKTKTISQRERQVKWGGNERDLGELAYVNAEIIVNCRGKKHCNTIYDHLPFYDAASAAQHRIEQQLHFVKLERMPVVKGDAFAVLLDSGVLEAEQALVFLELRYARGNPSGREIEQDICNEGE
jgi:hypothetical protein